jgi:hypothetical protein
VSAPLLQRFVLNGLSIQIGKCDLFPTIIVEPPVVEWPDPKVQPPLQAILFCPFVTCNVYTTCEPRGISIVGHYRYRGDPAPDTVLLALLNQLAAETADANLAAAAHGKVNTEAIVLAKDAAGAQELINKLEGLGGTKAAV